MIPYSVNTWLRSSKVNVNGALVSLLSLLSDAVAPDWLAPPWDAAKLLGLGCELPGTVVVDPTFGFAPA